MQPLCPVPALSVVLDSTPAIQRGMEIQSPSLSLPLFLTLSFFFHQAQAWHQTDGPRMVKGEREIQRERNRVKRRPREKCSTGEVYEVKCVYLMMPQAQVNIGLLCSSL